MIVFALGRKESLRSPKPDTTRACGINVAPIVNWLPIWPGCVNGKLTGEIVKYAPRGKLASSPAGDPVRVVGPEALARTATALLDARLAAFAKRRVVTKEAHR